MVNIQDARVRGDNHVFRCDFASRRIVQDISGVITTCDVNKYQNGISPTATTSKVVYTGTESLSINKTLLTVAIKFKLHTSGASTYSIIGKASGADIQWFIKLTSGTRLDFHIATTAADTTNYAYMNAPLLTLGNEYTAHCVYNGGLAAGSRGLIYINGAIVGTTINGTINTSMRAATQPINIFSGVVIAPPTDFILRSANIYSTAFSAADVLADYNNSLSSGITP